MNNQAKFLFSAFIIIIFLIFPITVSANNLSITNVSFGDRTPSSNSVVVEFDVSWDNTWRTKINHDAVWLTIRLHNPTVSPTDKKLCTISYAGLNPQGTSTGTNSDLEIFVPADKKGAFIRLADYGKQASVLAEDVELSIDYTSCGFNSTNDAQATIFGLEMVLIPEGAFYAGDYNNSTAALVQGSADVDPWYIADGNALSVTNASTDGYFYISGNQVGEDPTGSTFVIPAELPKGFQAFYAMKYELTEGQWVEFFNSLSSEARVNRDITDSGHKNSDAVLSRNTVSCSGAPATCSTSRTNRPVSFITWMDLAAFLDWAALRPMTELEYEKVSRGPILPNPGELTWGTTSITAAVNISGSDEDGSEVITDLGANANYNNTVLTGGDTATGPDYQQGPLRSGIFATNSSSRVDSGSGYYGVMELSGNLRERVVTIGNAAGRAFIGSNGDGVLTSVAGFEGNANQEDWPGIDADVSRGVTGVAGSGFRGGAWDDGSDRLRVSDRNDAANADPSALSNAGGRGVRTYDE